MATRGEIEFDFRKANDQAKKLDDIADRLKKLSATDFENTLQTLSANWKGANASTYLAKGSRLQDEMNATVRELGQVAADIRTIAKRIYDAEMEAIRIAESREYNRN